MVRAATWNASTHTLTWGSLGSSASPSSINNVLYAVSAVSPYTFWATGYDTNSSNLAQTLVEGYCALHFTASSLPGCAEAGTSYPVTLTVQNGSNTTVGAYRGTVHFSSSDGSAILPPDYTFTAGDAGSHTFMVTLQSTGAQTVTVSDIAMPLTVPAQQATVVTNGTCQAPAGTPGGRNITQSPPGTAGPRLPGVDGSLGVTGRTQTSTTGPRSSLISVTSVDTGGAGSVTSAQLAAELLALGNEFFTP
jgi:hypothetical protein